MYSNGWVCEPDVDVPDVGLKLIQLGAELLRAHLIVIFADRRTNGRTDNCECRVAFATENEKRENEIIENEKRENEIIYSPFSLLIEWKTKRWNIGMF